MKRVDHAEASSKFIEAKDHVDFHDKRLWDLRKKRDRESEAHARMGGAAHARLGDQGAHAHPSRRLPRGVRAQRDRQRHASCTGRATPPSTTRSSSTSCSAHGATTLVKSKSMLTDECEMRPFLENRGIEVIETDLGERIQQLDDEPPSHIVVPAVHKLRGDVARGVRRDASAPTRRTATCTTSPRASARHTRPYYPEGRRRHDRRQLRRRRDRQLRRLHQRGQRRPRAPTCRSCTSPRSASRSCIPQHRAPRRVRPHAVAQRARLADHADHLALPRAARRAPRCTSCWSTTAAPSASAWPTSGTRSSASAAAPA